MVTGPRLKSEISREKNSTKNLCKQPKALTSCFGDMAEGNGRQVLSVDDVSRLFSCYLKSFHIRDFRLI